MPARIIVQSGISAGATHWIERTVVRLGSDPHADVSVPSSSLDAHALTIEYRQGDYRIYNRGSHPLYLSGHVLAPGNSESWQDSELLELPDGTALALDLDDDPAPSPEPAHGHLVEHSASSDSRERLTHGTQAETPEQQTQPARKSSGKSSTAIQMAVTGICLLGCLLLLARHQLSGAASVSPPTPRFSEVVREARAPQQLVASELVDALQEAESAWVRGNRKTALARYRRLRDAVAAQTRGEPAAKLALENISRLINDRLSKLSNL